MSTNVIDLFDRHPSANRAPRAQLSGGVADVAKGILKQDTSGLDRRLVGRLIELAGGALPSRADAASARNCAARFHVANGGRR